MWSQAVFYESSQFDGNQKVWISLKSEEVSNACSQEQGDNASCISEVHDETSVISLTIYIGGIDQLSRLFSKLEGVERVKGVFRAVAESWIY